MTDETRKAPRDPDPADPAEPAEAADAEATGTAVAADEATTPTADETADETGDESDEETPDGSDDGAVEGPGASGEGRDGGRRTAVRTGKGRSKGRDASKGAGKDADKDAHEDADGAGGGGSSRAVLPLVPALGVLLVLLLAGTGYLLLTRPGTSSVSTDDYVDALQAARSGIVDVASFDYLTLDDDITQIEAVTTGDLQTESVDQLNGRRQDITTAQAVVNTEVVGAAVGAADDSTATVYMVIQSTQTSSASEQAQVQRYRIEVDLTQEDGRWLLSGISGR